MQRVAKHHWVRHRTCENFLFGRKIPFVPCVPSVGKSSSNEVIAETWSQLCFSCQACMLRPETRVKSRSRRGGGGGVTSSREGVANEGEPLCQFAINFTVNSHFRSGDHADVRGEVVPQSLPGPRQRHPADEDDEEQQVGEGSGEVNHLWTHVRLKKKKKTVTSLSLDQWT